jgi:membrane fusion protein, multidrug efflux system
MRGDDRSYDGFTPLCPPERLSKGGHLPDSTTVIRGLDPRIHGKEGGTLLWSTTGSLFIEGGIARKGSAVSALWNASIGWVPQCSLAVDPRVKPEDDGGGRGRCSPFDKRSGGQRGVSGAFAKILAALGFALLLTACSEEHQPEPQPIRPVLYVKAEPRAQQTYGFVGTVEPRYSTNLAFRTLGRIISRNVDVGDTVTHGETVATIDSTALDLSLQAARADLASAEAQFANASASEERQRALFEQGNIAQAMYDTARQARDAASANLEKAQAALSQAEDQRGYAQLKSDFDGVVSQVAAQVGQVVSAGQTVMTVARSDVREAVVDIPDSMIGGIPEGSPFDVVLQSAPSIRASGRVRQIAPQSDPVTRTRRVRITLDNPPPAFRLGSMISATRHVTVQPSVVLPLSALLEENGRTFVWIADPATLTVRKQEVQIVSRDGSSFAAGNIADGALVVTAGVHSLKEGEKVELPQEGAGQ